MRRIHYIDWLRVLAVLLLFPFHVSRVFNAEPFYVKGAMSQALNYPLGFIDVWHMPLLFALAGASTYLALKKRSLRQYTAERVRRLLVPFAFGLFVLIPPQTYLGGRFNSGYDESFLTYLASGDFLVWNIRDGGDYYGGFGIGHLWFILWLFFVSLLALPLLSWGKRSAGAERLSAWSRRLSHPAWWLAAALLVLLGEAMPDPVGKNVFYYLAFFVLGYVAIMDESLAEQAEQLRWPALAAAVALSAAWVALWPVREALPDPSVQLAAIAYLRAVASWLAIVAAIGFGRRHLDAPSAALAYLGVASYPIYILHQTVIVVLGYYAVRMPGGPGLEWLVLLAGSVAVTFALYEGARRVPLVRGLLGMR